MVLTRSMKDVWLFGGLDTLKKDRESGQVDGARPEDVKAVAEYVRQYVEEGRGGEAEQEGSRRHRRQREIEDDKS